MSTNFGTGYDAGIGFQLHSTGNITLAGVKLVTAASVRTGSGNASSSSGAPKPGRPSRTSQALVISVPAPQPAFTYRLDANRRVAFNDTSLGAVRYKWYFGDGATSTQRNPTHFYTSDGTYSVKLRVYNSAGDWNEAIQSISVSNIQPNASFTYVIGGTIVYFTDTSTTIASQTSEWDFGDGSTVTERNPAHVFLGNGTYNVTLQRGSFSKTQQITIDVELTLSCDAMAGADGYRWERSADGVTGWVEIADTATPSVGITEAVHGIKSTNINFFRVKAYNGGGESAYSSVVSAQCS